ncbi:hypothetical protein BVY01_01860 [bacterium I07]|nr:hypothetical protein BVY01_01860 [bacterium I07]
MKSKRHNQTEGRSERLLECHAWLRPVIICIFAALFACLPAKPLQSGKVSDSNAKRNISTGSINLPSDVPVHPKYRRWPAPQGGQSVHVNPPPLLWPCVNRPNISYDLRLSQDENFSDQSTIKADDLLWAMYNPHHVLDPGTWYWKYRVKRSGKKIKWSESFRFVIHDSIAKFSTPAIHDLIKRCQTAHPRLLITSAELPDFRKRNTESEEARILIREAEEACHIRLPGEEEGKPSRKGENAYERKKYAVRASKALAVQIYKPAIDLIKAYLLTDDDRFGKGAVRIAMHAARWDPDGVTHMKVSNFADAKLFHLMALTYDSCHDLLSEAQKNILLTAVRIRTDRAVRSFINNFEGRAFAAHNWQFIVAQCTEAAVATLGDIPEAELWLSYLYELWLNRVPVWGGDDGGWSNGNHYFQLNYETLTRIPIMYRQLTNVDFLNTPWYRRVMQYIILSWPPGSYCAGFGDGYDKETYPPLNRIAFAEILHYELKDHALQWYIEQCLAAGNLKLADDVMFRWHRLRFPRPSGQNNTALFSGIPQAQVFRDIGQVFMHSDLTRSELMHSDLNRMNKNVMVTLRSSPFGAFNHMHANQNAFNVLYGGKPMIHSSGYYIVMGDDHHQGWYKHTRGHNTILINGKGQSFDTEDYGWIPRFIDGKNVSYALADASNAYSGTGLSLFQRHLIFLKPSIVLIYDELEADQDSKWSWLLHAPNPFMKEKNAFSTGNEYGQALVRLKGSVPVSAEISQTFDPPAVNWMENKDEHGHIKQYPDQWHITWVNEMPVRKMRYLAVIQLGASEDNSVSPAAGNTGDSYIIGDWRIFAELDHERKASFVIENRSLKTALTYKSSNWLLKNRQFQTDHSESTVLIENGDVKEAADILPRAAEQLFLILHNQLPGDQL